ncbi:FadR/GntR family transcriptional regulator [Sphingomonas jatrophae]|uniref:Transcriptional regulator, GntR family n=1 Tax=Sphingomonas jatrophae TaxID=1166337 RepID=A0A1I6M2E4_9SPHN|nr:FCD domain-containing protein [Sphingomonas jatrophae]SFS09879.1 transcriptional regulator, GntR family [Sphingomonas jatrophae]
MSAALRAVEGGSLVDHALRRVREHIRLNDLKVGDTLPGEGWFATELGVSRAVMREAFGALAALRVIDVANGRRARIGAMDGSVMGASIDHAVATAQVSVAEVWDVRRTLELRTVELAALHRTPEQADEIVAAAEAMAAATGDLPQVMLHDIGLHQAIARASGNALYQQIVRSFEPLMKVAVPSAWQTRVTVDQQQEILQRHVSIAHAIRDGDPAAAVAEMRAHFVASIGTLLQNAGR